MLSKNKRRIRNVLIVTWFNTHNFGTSFQSYALHQFLANSGYHPAILDNEKKRLFLIRKIKMISSRLGILGFLYKLKGSTVSDQKLFYFISKSYHIKSTAFALGFRHTLKKTDVLCTGSDQIWNTYNKYDPFMFLDFTDSIKKIAYSTSIGTNSIPEEYKDIVRNHLSDFDHIGVREKTAVPILNDLLQRSDIRQVLDPVFLLSNEEWTSFSKKSKIDCTHLEPYVFSYFIGKNDFYEEQLHDVCDKINIKHIILIPAKENPDIKIAGTEVYGDADPYDFINLLLHATYVCTDSFHCTALSIKLKKDFTELIRFSDDDVKSQNSRIYDMLGRYNLMDRIYNEDNLNVKMTDYSVIEEKLNLDINQSKQFLIESIEK